VGVVAAVEGIAVEGTAEEGMAVVAEGMPVAGEGIPSLALVGSPAESVGGTEPEH